MAPNGSREWRFYFLITKQAEQDTEQILILSDYLGTSFWKRHGG
jgi:hypothetical protein